MPASEKTWRDMKLMHVVFAISSVAMLIGTLWMLVQDHNREWKQYQYAYYDQIEPWSTRARLAEQRNQQYVQGEQLRLRIKAEAQQQVPPEVYPRLFAASVLYEQRQQTQPSPELEQQFLQVVALAQAAGQAELQYADLYVQYHTSDDAAREQMQSRLDAARQAAQSLRQRLAQAAEALVQAVGDPSASPVWEAYQRLTRQPSQAAWQGLLQEMENVLGRVRYREDLAELELKFARAELDKVRSDLGLRLDQGASEQEVAQLQQQVDAVLADVEQKQRRYEALNTFRKHLDTLVAAVDAVPRAAERSLERLRLDVQRLEKTLAVEESFWTKLGKSIVRLPIFDAFNNTPVQIDNGWLPDLKIDFNFQKVARFDRCRTCHVSIDRTAPGSATEPAYPKEHIVRGIELALEQAPRLTVPGANGQGEAVLAPNQVEYYVKHYPEQAAQWMVQVYGFRFAPQGLLDRDAPTVQFVVQASVAARAGLKRGDVIEYVNDVKITSVEQARKLLLARPYWDRPVTLQVRRGLPHPYCAHPRLDLMVGDASPHPFKTFGCTICHDGRDGATEFRLVQHTPNTLTQLEDWVKRYRWFDNHHYWDLPMVPKRFAESNCLKCHHQVTELRPSDRYPDPPAPKLVKGHDLIVKYGCYGCHEINGYGGSGQRVGPDLRLEPNYSEIALRLWVDPALPAADREKRLRRIFRSHVPLQNGKPADPEAARFAQRLQQLTTRVVERPEDAQARRQLIQLLKEDQRRATSPTAQGPPLLQPRLYDLARSLQDVENPGRLRKVGPSLRYVASKLDREFLFNWIREPASYRPSTTMPQFFGQYDHLELAAKQFAAKDVPQEQLTRGQKELLQEPHRTAQLETVEVYALVHYLSVASDPFPYETPPKEVNQPASPERGKELFHTRGCLACHTHKDFPAQEYPEAQQDFGPDLSNLGAKLRGERGRRWLYSWLRNPEHYHRRTRMPNLFLEPVRHADGKVTDPAADITAYLLQDTGGWEPKYELPDPAADPKFQEALQELAMDHLSGTFAASQARQYLQNGIPEELAGTLKGDEIELVGNFTSEQQRLDHQLRFVGRRTLAKYGCFGCHEVPGFEMAKPIGTGLAGWGRKKEAQLAFEQISHYIELTEGEHGDGNSGHGEAEHGEHGGGHGHLDLLALPDKDKAFYLHYLLGHRRIGFLWQKLRAPRSYDYMKTQNKRYNERLRMPKFPFDQDQIEAVMTFVLGLTKEAPESSQYLYNPEPRRAAVMEGKRILRKYNCGGCHVLELERFRFAYDPEYPIFAAPRPFPQGEYEFFRPPFTTQDVEQSRQRDLRGLGHADIWGMIRRDADGVPLEGEDDEGNVTAIIQVWKPTLVNGQWWLPGDELMVPRAWLQQQGKHYPAWGGHLARLLYPKAVEIARANDAAGDLNAIWGWVPPPLVNQGRKTNSQWLHDFLLNPYPIRPAVLLRMPRFNMSSAEAEALAAYFAAVDGAEYPSEFNPRRDTRYLQQQEAQQPGRLRDAFSIVTHTQHCGACHVVQNFIPTRFDKAPNLADVYRRLRPEYVRQWLANPKRFLPYTAMPNTQFKLGQPTPFAPRTFPPHVQMGPVLQSGDPQVQLEAVTDLLLNWDVYLKQQQTIQAIQPPKGAAAAGSNSP